MGDNVVRALDGIDLEILSGSFWSIMGPSGAGKSTLLHIIGMLDEPTAGEYTFLGDDVAKMREVEGGFAIKAGGTHALQRGGDHLMIMGLETVPVIGDTVMITLTFETAGDVTVPFAVMDATTAGEMDHGKMDHGKTGHSQMKSDN